MGKQREVLALISHWNESAACVREECSGLNASSLLTPPHPPRISNQFKATTNEKHGTFSAVCTPDRVQTVFSITYLSSNSKAKVHRTVQICNVINLPYGAHCKHTYTLTQ